MCKIFAYKGYIGIDGTGEPLQEGEEFDVTKHLSNALINDPSQPGQMGFGGDISKCKISPEAIELLKTIKNGRDDLGDIMCFGSDPTIIGWLGGSYLLSKPEDLEGSSDCEFSKLSVDAEYVSDDVEIPQGFKDAVNAL